MCSVIAGDSLPGEEQQSFICNQNSQERGQRILFTIKGSPPKIKPFFLESFLKSFNPPHGFYEIWVETAIFGVIWFFLWVWTLFGNHTFGKTFQKKCFYFLGGSPNKYILCSPEARNFIKMCNM